MAGLIPPIHLLANNGRGDRMVLVHKLAAWHETVPKDRHISFYINPIFLDLPAVESFPKKWSDQGAKTSYRSFRSGMSDITDWDLAPRQMKKAHGEGAEVFLDKARTRPRDISSQMITKVSIAILMYIMQDKRFCSQEHGPLPEFNTPEQRKAWFSQILTEKPLLCMIFVFSLYRSSTDVPFIYSDRRYGVRLDAMKDNLRRIVHLRLCALLELIFSAQFNLSRMARGVGADTYRRWITKNVETEFRSGEIRDLQPDLNDIPILQTWPKITRKALWWKLLGGEGAGDEMDSEGDD